MVDMMFIVLKSLKIMGKISNYFPFQCWRVCVRWRLTSKTPMWISFEFFHKKPDKTFFPKCESLNSGCSLSASATYLWIFMVFKFTLHHFHQGLFINVISVSSVKDPSIMPKKGWLFGSIWRDPLISCHRIVNIIFSVSLNDNLNLNNCLS